ncbi:ATP-binding protein [Streptomyces sp. NBC_01622]|uniref:ATP-binding protein n=1 Tax=Streptomyces sp. NBC_01622 TaxID=2975903 RepID=UPI0038690583|nr:ATP-binding protein [Streptomyces sp. NBC_01622]
MRRATSRSASKANRGACRASCSPSNGAPHGPHPHPPQIYRLRTPNSPTSPKICRDLVALLLQVTGHHQHADTARLLVSEIVTNVNLHTDSLAVRLEVVLRHDRLRVSVYDDALDADPRQKPGDAYDENGRGLLLLTGLARDWGVQRSASAHGTPAKQIWFELGGAPCR